MEKLIYKSMYKNKGKAFKEDQTKKLFKIREELKQIKSSLREQEDEANPEAVESIIDKIEDLVVSAVQTLGATDEVTQELIATAEVLEDIADEEQMIKDIEELSNEADEIQESLEEDFEPIYDLEGNVINYSPEDDMYDDEMYLDDDIYGDGMLSDELGYYEKYDRKSKKVKKFRKKSVE